MDEATQSSQPKRQRRALAWAGRVLAGLLVLAVVGWVVADVVYGHMLNVRLAELRRAGEPLTVEEVLGPEPPAAENAAPLYTAALTIDLGKELPLTETIGPLGKERSRALMHYAARGEDAALAQEVLHSPEARQLLAKLQQASQRPHCRFPFHWAYGIRMPENAAFPLSMAAYLPLAQAREEFAQGHQKEGVAWLLCAMRMARHLGEQYGLMPYLLAQPTYYTIRRVAAVALIGHDLPPDLSAMLRQELARLDASALLRQTLEAEKVATLYLLDFYANPAVNKEMRGKREAPPPTLAPLARPFLHLQTLYYLAHWQELLRDLPTLSAIRAKAPAIKSYGLLDVLGRMMASSMAGIGTARGRIQATQYLFVAALALNDYHYAHHAYPATLAELGQPLPLDPFSGKPFCYSRAGEGYVLYSVGENGVDDGGRPRKSGEASTAGDLLWGN